MPTPIQEPWLAFLRDVDEALAKAVEVHCLGGFVLSVLWDLPRPTGDVDIVEVRPNAAASELLRIAGDGTALHAKHHLRFDRVTIAEFPEGYEGRLVDITPGGLRRLRLLAMEVHDVVLAKLSRNSPRDRADVEFLAKRGALDPRVLEERFETELQPYLLNPAREELTLRLWLDALLGDERR